MLSVYALLSIRPEEGQVYWKDLAFRMQISLGAPALGQVATPPYALVWPSVKKTLTPTALQYYEDLIG